MATQEPEQQTEAAPQPRGVQLDTPLAVGVIALGALAVIAAVRVGFGGALAHAK